MTVYSTQFLQQEGKPALDWIKARAGRSDFAASLDSFLTRRGYLTEGQYNAVVRCIAKDAERAEAASTAPAVSTEELEKVFAVALGNGLKAPKLTVGAYRFSPAKSDGANPGAIYVKNAEDGAYLGKMQHGRFLARITGEFVKEVLAIAADPKGEAIKHGHLTGRCSVCSRKLSDTDSVARGMGPICASKFGW